MRTDLVPVPEALALILEGAAPSGEESVALAAASGRVLSRDVASLRTQPPFPASAMDGYAVRADDIAAPQATLRVIGESSAGKAFAGALNSGEAVRIFTGAPVPAGADTVVMQENVRREGDNAIILKSAERGKSVRAAGLDFREGEVLLRRGDVLDPIRLALAASMNHPSLPVFRRPRVVVASTGNELRKPGEVLGPDQIVSSNAFGVAAAVALGGGEPHDMGVFADTREALRAFFASAFDSGADLVVTTGGASVGDHDLVLPLLGEMGARFLFSKVRIRPGKPLVAGSIEWKGRNIRLLGLAGNPVSALVATAVFVAPVVSALAGRPGAGPAPVDAVLGRDLGPNDERDDYMRASSRRLPGGAIEVTPFATQDSSMLATLARADALLVRPAHAPAAAAGDACKAILLRPPA